VRNRSPSDGHCSGVLVVQLQAVAVEVFEIDRLADAVLVRGDRFDASVEHRLAGIGERLRRRVRKCEVIQSWSILRIRTGRTLGHA
jgi:hypothetical protein